MEEILNEDDRTIRERGLGPCLRELIRDDDHNGDKGRQLPDVQIRFAASTVVVAYGSASNRAIGIGCPVISHVPYRPFSMRSWACRTRIKRSRAFWTIVRSISSATAIAPPSTLSGSAFLSAEPSASLTSSRASSCSDMIRSSRTRSSSSLLPSRFNVDAASCLAIQPPRSRKGSTEPRIVEDRSRESDIRCQTTDDRRQTSNDR